MIRTGSLQQSLMLVGKFDEDVFEAGSERANLAHGDIVFQELLAEIVEIAMIVDERMNGLSENCGAANARNLARETERAGNFGGGDFHALSAMGLDVGEFAKRIGRPISDELSVINVGDVAAALGLQAVDTSVELPVFRDGQVVIEAEILRHVADALADRFRIRADIEAFDMSLAAAERQEAGEHFDDGGLSAAIGAEETEDFAFLDVEADIVDGGEAAEAAHEMLGR